MHNNGLKPNIGLLLITQETNIKQYKILKYALLIIFFIICFYFKY